MSTVDTPLWKQRSTPAPKPEPVEEVPLWKQRSTPVVQQAVPELPFRQVVPLGPAPPDPKRVEGYTKYAQALSGTPPLGLGEHAAAAQIPAEDWELFKAIAATQYAKDQTMRKAGYGTRLATSLIQGAIDFAMPLAKRVPGSPIPKLTPEQERFKEELLQLREGIDPTVRPDTNVLGRGVQQAGRMTFPMVSAVAGGKGLGVGAGAAGFGKAGIGVATAVGTSGSFLPQMADDTYTALIREGVPHSRAWKITAVSAPIEAAIESILPDPLSGFRGAFRGTARRVAAQFLKRATLNYTKELGEEGLQRIVREVALEVGREMDAKIPNQGYGSLLSVLLT